MSASPCSGKAQPVQVPRLQAAAWTASVLSGLSDGSCCCCSDMSLLAPASSQRPAAAFCSVDCRQPKVQERCRILCTLLTPATTQADNVTLSGGYAAS